MRPNDAVSHEAAHGAAALLVGIAVDGYAFDRMGWDGWVGQTLLNGDALRALEGSYRDRLALATLAFMPYVVLFGEPEGTSDMALVEAMRPTGYSREIWRWVVEQHAPPTVSIRGLRAGVRRGHGEDRAADGDERVGGEGRSFLGVSTS